MDRQEWLATMENVISALQDIKGDMADSDDEFPIAPELIQDAQVACTFITHEIPLDD